MGYRQGLLDIYRDVDCALRQDKRKYVSPKKPSNHPPGRPIRIIHIPQEHMNKLQALS